LINNGNDNNMPGTDNEAHVCIQITHIQVPLYK